MPWLLERVEDVADVAAVDVVFVGVDDDGAGDGELFADEAAAGGASFVSRSGASMRARRIDWRRMTSKPRSTSRRRCRRR